MAVRLGLLLVCLPTALAVNAFLIWASGLRQEGLVVYLETLPPGKLLEIIRRVPPSIRAAGICDVLSIATGCRDWQFAEQQSQNPAGMQLIPYVYNAAQAILQGALG